MSAAPSPAPTPAPPAASSRPKAARYSSTRSATCRWRRRRASCGCYSRGKKPTAAGRRPTKADVRIVAASNKDLRQLIQQGLFREDLFFRLNVVPLRLPPLRERIEDIPDLIRHFFKLAEREGLPQKQIDQAALERLKQHRWPGNVRELENLARRLAALYPQEVINLAGIETELSLPSVAPIEEIAAGNPDEGLSAS